MQAPAVVFRCNVHTEVTKLEVVGSIEQLGDWSLSKSVKLLPTDTAGGSQGESTVVWESEPVQVLSRSFPFQYKYIANGHRSSPTTRPLTWDVDARTCIAPGTQRVEVDVFEPTPHNSDSGWVTADGMGAFQLRVGQPPGSTLRLVTLRAECDEPNDVRLYEATPGDPAVPQGKPFARLSHHDLASSGAGQGALSPQVSPRLASPRQASPQPSPRTLQEEGVTYLMNGQTIDDLAFRVDVTSKADGRLLARCYVSAATLGALSGKLAATLVGPELHEAGLFTAEFLVVTACDHPENKLHTAQRRRWSPHTAATLDIGHRGSGASKEEGHSVRENTILSFQKAATNNSDFIEFDVHVTCDGVVVVHHDFDIKLSLGKETLRLAIPSLSSQQLQSPEFTQYMSLSSADEVAAVDMLDAQRDRHRRALKRNMTSAEDMFRTAMRAPEPSMEPIPEPSPANGGGNNRWRLSDRIATLREAFRRTPLWLGFNIELKYPTDAELAAMTTRFYSRNYFCDAVLKVVFEEAGLRKIIFSSFDPDCATLVRLKQPRYPCFFLTCAGTKRFSDPRMNSLSAALAYARASQLQGVVVEASALLGRLGEVVAEFHRHGLFLFTWGNANNVWEHYAAQKAAGVDAIIADDVAKHTQASGKRFSLFKKPMKSPASFLDVQVVEALSHKIDALLVGSPAPSAGIPAQA